MKKPLPVMTPIFDYELCVQYLKCEKIFTNNEIDMILDVILDVFEMDLGPYLNLRKCDAYDSCYGDTAKETAVDSFFYQLNLDVEGYNLFFHHGR